MTTSTKSSVTLHRDRPLFEVTLPVQYNATGAARTGEKILLTVRVINGIRHLTVGQSQRLLHIELTNEDDYGFLYTLQIGEDDYPALKKEQSLRVDFGDFASQFIELVKNCDPSSTQTQHPSHSLNIEAGSQTTSTATRQRGSPASHFHSSYLEFVEATAFKNVSVLKLRLREGNDEDIKGFLGDHLQLVSRRIFSFRWEVACGW